MQKYLHNKGTVVGTGALAGRTSSGLGSCAAPAPSPASLSASSLRTAAETGSETLPPPSSHHHH